MLMLENPWETDKQESPTYLKNVLHLTIFCFVLVFAFWVNMIIAWIHFFILKQQTSKMYYLCNFHKYLGLC